MAATITEVPGSSDVFDRGFVTYANAAKSGMLGVPATVIARRGSVSPEVARAMALGALRESRAHVAVAITGVAGPGGGSDDKPVGLVHFAAARRGGEVRLVEKRFGDIGRGEVRRRSAAVALDLLLRLAGVPKDAAAAEPDQARP